MPKLKVRDIQMYYETKGDGFPLLLITGSMGNADCWDPLYFIPRLSERFKLIMFDNRGAGRTDVSDQEYSIRLFADDAAGLMEAMRIRRAHVLGFCMGGMIAQELALNYPEKVEKLVLVSTCCGGKKSVFSPEAAQMVIDTSTALSKKGAWDEEIAQKLVSHVFTEEFMREYPGAVDVAVQLVLTAPTSLEALVSQIYAVLTFDACDRLPQIKAPTLILAGKKDRCIPPENAEIMAKLIPNSRLVYFENSGHVLQEDIEKVTATVLEFLATPEAEPI